MLDESRKEELLKFASDLLEKEAKGAGVGVMKGMATVVGDGFVNSIKNFGKHVMGTGTVNVGGASLNQGQLTRRLIGSGRALSSRPGGQAVRKGAQGHGPATSGGGARSAVRDKAVREEMKKGVAALRAKKYLARGAVATGGYMALRGGASGADAYDKAVYRHYRG